jgi:hypothetical protein
MTDDVVAERGMRILKAPEIREVFLEVLRHHLRVRKLRFEIQVGLRREDDTSITCCEDRFLVFLSVLVEEGVVALSPEVALV